MRNPIHLISPDFWFSIRPSVFRILGKLSIFHQSYAPFVVLSTPRSGSTLLIQSLRQHPQIVTRDEILNPSDPDYIEGSPDKSLRRVYLPQPLSIKAVGCKIHYMQSPFGDDIPFEGSSIQEACAWLEKSKPDLKVIHLVRENRLRVQVSLLLAHASNRWFVPRSSGLEVTEGNKMKVTVDIEAWQHYMKRTEMKRRKVFSCFMKHPVEQVKYSELVQDWSDTIQRVQAFLDVKPQLVPQQTRKQNPEPLSELIDNYGEVKAFLQGTDQEWMLEEDV